MCVCTRAPRTLSVPCLEEPLSLPRWHQEGLFKGKSISSPGGTKGRRIKIESSSQSVPVLTSVLCFQIEMAQKLLNSDLGELINKMKLAQQYVMTSLQQEYKKQMLTAAHALAVDAKNLLDVIDQARLRVLGHARPR